MSKKSKKQKVSVPAIETVDGLRAAVNHVVELQTQLARRMARHELEVARLNSEFDAETATVVALIEAHTASAHVYCEANRGIFPKDTKSIECRNATVGFRLNPPKVEKVVAKDTFTAIAKRLQAVAWGSPFVAIAEPEVNKEALLSERANLPDDRLLGVGLRIVQEETFYIKPNAETAPPITV